MAASGSVLWGSVSMVIVVAPRSEDVRGRRAGPEGVPVESLHPLRPRVVGPQLTVLVGGGLDASEPVLLDDLAAPSTHLEDVWDAAAGDADRLHGRLGPVLAVVLFEQPGRPEDVIGKSDEQLADFGRSVDRREREPPDLSVLRVPRDA